MALLVEVGDRDHLGDQVALFSLAGEGGLFLLVADRTFQEGRADLFLVADQVGPSLVVGQGVHVLEGHDPVGHGLLVVLYLEGLFPEGLSQGDLYLVAHDLLVGLFLVDLFPVGLFLEGLVLEGLSQVAHDLLEGPCLVGLVLEGLSLVGLFLVGREEGLGLLEVGLSPVVHGLAGPVLVGPVLLVAGLSLVGHDLLEGPYLVGPYLVVLFLVDHGVDLL